MALEIRNRLQLLASTRWQPQRQGLTSLLPLCVLLCLSLAPAQAKAESATIATASNFKATMTELMAAFEQGHPQHQLRQINAASGLLYNQIIQGAPFDVFLAADSRYPRELEQRGTGISQSRFSYAQGRLVLMFAQKPPKPTATTETEFVAALKKAIASKGRIAIANSTTAPYGIAAIEVIEHLQLAAATQPRLVSGNNIGQTFQFVKTGNAALGFVALSQVSMPSTAQPQQSSNYYYWLIPEQWHQPIRQQAILLQFGQDNPAAVAFLAFLQTPQAHHIIRQYGYSVPAP
ncbi:MAG: molybdate ABC transporter substrate-binding protein [Spongiibacteraceae bacterium]|jgi:molybdate transport system substrate-binding protein